MECLVIQKRKEKEIKIENGLSPVSSVFEMVSNHGPMHILLENAHIDKGSLIHELKEWETKLKMSEPNIQQVPKNKWQTRLMSVWILNTYVQALEKENKKAAKEKKEKALVRANRKKTKANRNAEKQKRLAENAKKQAARAKQKAEREAKQAEKQAEKEALEAAQEAESENVETTTALLE